MYGYTDLGEVLRIWRHRTYPVEYGYDSYGDLTTMKTYQSDTGSTWTASSWPASPPAAYTTTWVRDAGTGLVSAKTDAAGKSTQWTYLPDGRVAARQWVEKKDLGGGTLKERVTKYAYGDTGALSGVDYVWGVGGAEQNDTDTPDIGYTYRRDGQVTGVTDGTGTRAFTYTSLAVLEWETLPALFKSSASTNRRVVIQRQGSGSGLLPGRYAGAQVVAGGLSGEHALVVDHDVDLGYDSSGRYSQVAFPGSATPFRYQYLGSSDLTDLVTGPVLKRDHDYETNRDSLASVKNLRTSNSANQSTHLYTTNTLGQRERARRYGPAFTGLNSQQQDYLYNDRGEVTSEQVKRGTSATDTTPDNTWVTSLGFQFDALGNRDYTTEDPGAPGSSGGSSVTDQYTANSVNAYTYIQSTGSNQPAHDADGNLKSVGGWTYTWNGENQLIEAGDGSRSVAFVYDYAGRRTRKTVKTGSTVDEDWGYAYEGWNLAAEYDLETAYATLVRRHTWGSDLSGDLQGAGGVGGLLATEIVSGANTGVYYPCYDGNGNVTDSYHLVDTTLTNVAHYEYDGFGRLLASSGSLKGEFDIQFSSKFFDQEIGLYYYGYRYYDPASGRWLNRDPIGEDGGLNLYGFVGNAGVNLIDGYGLYGIKLIFNAFISGERGRWLDEPMGGLRASDLSPLNVYRLARRQFRSDLRHFGAFSESAGNARLFSIAEIDSEMIGQADSKADLVRAFSKAGESHQRTRYGYAIFGSGSAGVGAPPPVMGYKWSEWVERAATSTVDDAEVEVESPDICTTTIKFTPEAKYPFVSVLGLNPSPEIDYEVTFMLVKRIDVNASDPPITVILSGVHDAFPDYEGYVQDTLIYTKYSRYPGPDPVSLGGIGNRVTIPDNTGLSLLGR